jgi:nitrate reductase NapAB chaperone NapD
MKASIELDTVQASILASDQCLNKEHQHTGVIIVIEANSQEEESKTLL